MEIETTLWKLQEAVKKYYQAAGLTQDQEIALSWTIIESETDNLEWKRVSAINISLYYLWYCFWFIGKKLSSLSVIDVQLARIAAWVYKDVYSILNKLWADAFRNEEEPYEKAFSLVKFVFDKEFKNLWLGLSQDAYYDLCKRIVPPLVEDIIGSQVVFDQYELEDRLFWEISMQGIDSLSTKKNAMYYIYKNKKEIEKWFNADHWLADSSFYSDMHTWIDMLTAKYWVPNASDNPEELSWLLDVYLCHFINKIVLYKKLLPLLQKHEPTNNLFLQKYEPINNLSIDELYRFTVYLNPPQKYIIQSLKFIVSECEDVDSMPYKLQEYLRIVCQIVDKKIIFNLINRYIRELFSIESFDSSWKKDRFESNRSHLSDVLEVAEIESLYSNFIEDREENISWSHRQKLSKLKIGMIFWSVRSYAAFNMYLNNPIEVLLQDRWLWTEQFVVLCKEFKKQKNLDIWAKLISWSIGFVLSFETDHTTDFERNVMKKYPNRIVSSRANKQHFSKESFESMLDTGLEKYL